MPISDYLVSLALALHPQSAHKTPLLLGADVVSQPGGGATLVLASCTKACKDAGLFQPPGVAAVAPPPQICPKGEKLVAVKNAAGAVTHKCAPVAGPAIKTSSSLAPHAKCNDTNCAQPK